MTFQDLKNLFFTEADAQDDFLHLSDWQGATVRIDQPTGEYEGRVLEVSADDDAVWLFVAFEHDGKAETTWVTTDEAAFIATTQTTAFAAAH